MVTIQLRQRPPAGKVSDDAMRRRETSVVDEAATGVAGRYEERGRRLGALLGPKGSPLQMNRPSKGPKTHQIFRRGAFLHKAPFHAATASMRASSWAESVSK